MKRLIVCALLVLVSADTGFARDRHHGRHGYYDHGHGHGHGRHHGGGYHSYYYGPVYGSAFCYPPVFYARRRVCDDKRVSFSFNFGGGGYRSRSDRYERYYEERRPIWRREESPEVRYVPVVPAAVPTNVTNKTVINTTTKVVGDNNNVIVNSPPPQPPEEPAPSTTDEPGPVHRTAAEGEYVTFTVGKCKVEFRETERDGDDDYAANVFDGKVGVEKIEGRNRNGKKVKINFNKNGTVDSIWENGIKVYDDNP